MKLQVQYEDLPNIFDFEAILSEDKVSKMIYYF